MSENSEKSVKILRASAGSGKTYRLAYEYIKRVISRPLSYRTILAVTFTNKATSEMKTRILESLNRLSRASELSGKVEYLDELSVALDLSIEAIQKRAKEAQRLILHDYSNFAISTIDKFFQRITRSFFKELGYDFTYQVELSSDHYLQRAAIELIGQSATDPELSSLLERVLERQIEKNRWNITEDLVKIGKLITYDNYRPAQHSCAQLIEAMGEISAELSTKEKPVRDACAEFISSIGSVGLAPDDFASKSKGFAGFIAKIAQGDQMKPSSKALISAAQCDSEVGLFAKNAQCHVATVASLGLLGILREIVARNDEYHSFASSYSAVKQNFDSRLLLEHLSASLDRIMGENNALPIYKTTSLVADIAATNDTSFIYEKLGNHYNEYMIDEFQDTSLSQWLGFLPLLRESISRVQGEAVLLIGDIKQAIYRWRGGDWNILDSLALTAFDSGEVDAAEQLDTNWRSDPMIVEFNNRLLAQVIEIDGAKLSDLTSTSRDSATYQGALSRAYSTYRQKAREGSLGGYVQVDQSEQPLDACIARIASLKDDYGYRLRDIAVLVRTNKQGEQIASALIAAGFNVISDEALKIASSPTVGFVINVLRLVQDPTDALSLAQINMYLGHDIDSAMSEHVQEFVNSLGSYALVDALDRVMDYFELRDKELSYLQALYQAVYEYSKEYGGDVTKFLEWWKDASQTISLSLPKDQDAVTIISIHKAKGLQYPAVLIPWCNWSLLPSASTQFWVQAQSEPFAALGLSLVNYKKDLEGSYFNEDFIRETLYSHIDNINLLYVALTRAQNSLFIFTGSEKGAANSVATLVNIAIKNIECTFDPQNLTYSFGELQSLQSSSGKMLRADSINFSTLASWDISDRVATVQPYTPVQEKGIQGLDARHYGVLMHGVLSQIERVDEIPSVIASRVLSGEINSTQGERLLELLGEALSSDPRIVDWFSGEWQIFNERAIVIPDQLQTKRPDRVMLQGQRAVVVDYKFGLPSPKHSAQVSQYVQLLREMGFSDTQGYLWYVSEARVDECP